MTRPSDSRSMAAFLAEVRKREPAGKVSLGALPGFPAMTNDPEVVARAIETIEKRAATSSALRELRLRQRLIDLRASLTRLRASDNGESDARRWFIAEGAAWCQKAGISYAALRDYGVPAGILAEAGVKR
jgi:hypothetical protein